MDNYWNEIWKNPNLDEFQRYINRHVNSRPEFLNIFQEYKITNVCDAACGFGAYSAMLVANGYHVIGFDIAPSSIELARILLNTYGINTSEYFVSSIVDIKQLSESFDAVVAHAVIDHLVYEDAFRAIEELLRIVKSGGLVYISFDGIEEEDREFEHVVLDDGSFLYTDCRRDGLLFRYYTDEDIRTLLQGRNVIYSKVKENGEREIIIQK